MDCSELNIGYSLGLTSSYFKLAVISLMKEHGFSEITPEQYAILFILTKQDGVYQRQISQILMKDRPNVTRMLSILEKKGFIRREKNPENKRISKVFITQKGNVLVERMNPYRKSLNKKYLKGISKEEIGNLLSTLQKIRVNLQDSFNIQI